TNASQVKKFISVQGHSAAVAKRIFAAAVRLQTAELGMAGSGHNMVISKPIMEQAFRSVVHAENKPTPKKRPANKKWTFAFEKIIKPTAVSIVRSVVAVVLMCVSFGGTVYYVRHYGFPTTLVSFLENVSLKLGQTVIRGVSSLQNQNPDASQKSREEQI